jgi:hypothetical protein
MFTSAVLLDALEQAWIAIRTRHPEVPAAVLVVGAGSPVKPAQGMKWGHFDRRRWQVGPDRFPEVLVSGEGLSRTPVEVFTTLLHEAAHGLADARSIKDTSRQGRWHNQRFAVLAAELGMTTSKDPKLGHSICTLTDATVEHYLPAIAILGQALRAWRHPDQHGPTTGRTNNNNGVTAACACPRKIRVAPGVLDLGPIVCDLCDTPFATAEQENAVPRHNFYDPTGARHGGTPTYPYKCAPTGLATRRQLRRLGLRPGGQDITAQILWRKGKRVAHLYRIDHAKPKRVATDAQLKALDKAMRARRTCPTCQSIKDYYIPRRYGECLDCAPAVKQ